MVLAAILCCTMTMVSFTSCDDDEEEEITSNIYTYGFLEVTTTSFSEMATIENVFTSALGVSSTPFGSVAI